MGEGGDDLRSDGFNSSGAIKGDMSKRRYRQERGRSVVQFSPYWSGRAAASTEGRYISSMKNSFFRPFDLSIDLTPQSISLRPLLSRVPQVS